jgi:hypothetical protein
MSLVEGTIRLGQIVIHARAAGRQEEEESAGRQRSRHEDDEPADDTNG